MSQSWRMWVTWSTNLSTVNDNSKVANTVRWLSGGAVQLQRISSALLYTAGCPEPYYISLSRVESEPVAGRPCLDRSDTVSHVSHQFSRLWWISMAVHLKVVSVRVLTESSVLNKFDDISGIQYEMKRTGPKTERHSSRASLETFRRYSEQTACARTDTKISSPMLMN